MLSLTKISEMTSSSTEPIPKQGDKEICLKWALTGQCSNKCARSAAHLRYQTETNITRPSIPTWTAAEFPSRSEMANEPSSLLSSTPTSLSLLSRSPSMAKHPTNHITWGGASWCQRGLARGRPNPYPLTHPSLLHINSILRSTHRYPPGQR